MKIKLLLAGIALLSLDNANAMHMSIEEFGNPDFHQVVKAFKENQPLEIKGQKYQTLREEDQSMRGIGPWASHLQGKHYWFVKYNPCYTDSERDGAEPRLLHMHAVRHIPDDVIFYLYDVKGENIYESYFTLRYTAKNNPHWEKEINPFTIGDPRYFSTEIYSGVTPKYSVNFLLKKM